MCIRDRLPCHFVMQEHYSTGEPSEEMMNQILHDLQGTDYDRVIAVGGGTVIDICLLYTSASDLSLIVLTATGSSTPSYSFRSI